MTVSVKTVLEDYLKIFCAESGHSISSGRNVAVLLQRSEHARPAVDKNNMHLQSKSWTVQNISKKPHLNARQHRRNAHGTSAHAATVYSWNNGATSWQKQQHVSTTKFTANSSILQRCAYNSSQQKIGWLVEQGLTSHSTQFRSFRRRCIYRSNDPTNSVKALKEGG